MRMGGKRIVAIIIAAIGITAIIALSSPTAFVALFSGQAQQVEGLTLNVQGALASDKIASQQNVKEQLLHKDGIYAALALDASSHATLDLNYSALLPDSSAPVSVLIKMGGFAVRNILPSAEKDPSNLSFEWGDFTYWNLTREGKKSDAGIWSYSQGAYDAYVSAFLMTSSGAKNRTELKHKFINVNKNDEIRFYWNSYHYDSGCGLFVNGTQIYPPKENPYNFGYVTISQKTEGVLTISAEGTGKDETGFCTFYVDDFQINGTREIRQAFKTLADIEVWNGLSFVEIPSCKNLELKETSTTLSCDVSSVLNTAESLQNAQVRAIIHNEYENITAKIDYVYLDMNYSAGAEIAPKKPEKPVQEKRLGLKLKKHKDVFRHDENAVFDANFGDLDTEEKLEAAISAQLITPENKIEDLNADEIEREETGKYKLKLKSKRFFAPGLYVLRVKAKYGISDYSSEERFYWGVLAINTNKGIFLPNETANLSIGVLDENGSV